MLCLPGELHSEILSYLHDDRISTAACAMVHRTLIAVCQQQLFRAVSVGQHHKSSGSGSAFYRLLKQSPHIAPYVRCLYINFSESPPKGLDFDLRYEADQANLQIFTEIIDPLASCLPSLTNLTTLNITCKRNWSGWEQQYITKMLPVVRLPSLHHLKVCGIEWGALIESASSTIKHLDLIELDVLSRRSASSTSSTIYLESLKLHFGTDGKAFKQCILDNPKSRINISRLKRISINLQRELPFRHNATWKILQKCAESLEELVFAPGLRIGRRLF